MTHPLRGWPPEVEIWERRAWLPFPHTVGFYGTGDTGRGPFAGWCYKLSGPGIPEGVGWCRKRDDAIRRGRQERDRFVALADHKPERIA